MQWDPRRWTGDRVDFHRFFFFLIERSAVLRLVPTDTSVESLFFRETLDLPLIFECTRLSIVFAKLTYRSNVIQWMT